MKFKLIHTSYYYKIYKFREISSIQLLFDHVKMHFFCRICIKLKHIHQSDTLLISAVAHIFSVNVVKTVINLIFIGKYANLLIQLIDQESEMELVVSSRRQQYLKYKHYNCKINYRATITSVVRRI